MARRSFSLMLAWRYLNPRRAMLSSVTIISVTGVLLGVWILVVVMSVFNGLEREVKNRLLGYAPHIKLEFAPDGTRIPLQEWREISEKLSHHPEVESSAPYIQDFVIMDSEGRHRPGVFRAVDSQNPVQVKGIEDLLNLTKYPGGSADMGLDKRVVISSVVAEQLGLGVGDKIKFYSARNFEQVQGPYELTNQPLLRDRFRALLTGAEEALAQASGFKKQGDQVIVPEANYRKLVEFSNAVYPELGSLREKEGDLVNEFLLLLETDDRTPEGRLLAAEAPAQAAAKLKALEETDRDQMDLETLKSIREVILPQEAEIIGVTQSNQMAVMPDLFLPMPLAQQLSGMNGDSAQAISVRLHDYYQAEPISRELLKDLPPGWQATTWIAEFGSFSNLINQQRVMMYIVLSMIIVISAFSMMAVMFTVTIQKRREIGVMKALGAAPGQIVRVFLNQGIILGAVGSVLGVGFGLVTLRLRGNLQDFLRTFGFDPFPADFNGFPILPAHLVPLEVAIIAVCAFILCSLAAMVPAVVASRSDAAKSLRNL